MDVSVLIPSGIPDGRERDRNLAWTVDWWTAHFPDWEVIVGRSETFPYRKAAAFNAARAEATGDVFVLADGDVFADLDVVTKLAADATRGVWGWPWDQLHRMGTHHSTAVAACPPGGVVDVEFLDEDRQYGHVAGGMVIMHATMWDRVGGIDPRFEGYGGEDNALIASVAMFYGPPVRCPGWLHHLWHPSQPDRWSPVDPARVHRPNWKLWARYRDAKTQEAMQAIFDERGDGAVQRS